ncbi:hypothetical protein F5144DRAFT_652456 [Chaetomium tenue]|uniref:Uncharacterized protein n=1 Tax=Chaetomium tenue TaxID=1854479 RepID=A0ACB7P3R8_9PEZI|nr:hypothetical protein F5144DRAFT_652456 [Chaetomium globosum]
MDALTFLVCQLRMEDPHTAAFFISCFNDYAYEYLLHHPDVLDPDFAHIRARVHLTMAHRPVGWLWTQETPWAKQSWGQEEHATAFVLHVLDYVYNRGYISNDFTIDQAIWEIHRRLCMLQSLCLGNGIWVEDAVYEKNLQKALYEQMRMTAIC